MNLKSKISKMAWLSGIGSISLILAIIGFVFKLDIILITFTALYILCRVRGNILWRCPKCRAKLPKGNTININKCTYCNCDLML